MLSGTLLDNSGAHGAPTVDFGAVNSACTTVTTRFQSESPRNPRVKLLTEGERECLRLVYQHMTSKDIARQLGVSHHAVDMRLRQAIRKLEVVSRIDAARALIAEEGISSTESMATDYQPLIYQAPELEENVAPVTFGSPASNGAGAASERSSDPNQLEPGSLARTLHPLQTRPDAGPSGGSLAKPDALAGNVAFGSTLATDWPGIAAPDPGIGARPFLTSPPWGARNDLAIGHRLGWMLFIAFASAMTFGGVLAAFAALKTLI
jgi:DNA-binding CsgD family transcriptional regulator